MSAPGGLLLLAFGGPHKSEDVRPFLRHVLAGRPVPEERFESVVHHYELLGGRSPITEHTTAQARALETALAKRGVALPVRVGMRHSTPWIRDALAAFRDAGQAQLLALIMAAQETEASLSRYQEAVDAAREELGAGAPEVRYVLGWGLADGVIAAHVDHLSLALAGLEAGAREQAAILFSAHSIPVAMARESPYVTQLETTAARIAHKLAIASYELIYQSRSGNPREPWLGPDVLDVLDTLAQRGVRHVVIAPIGFVCDHVEVLYDLDIEARARAEELGLSLTRAATLGSHPAFIAALADAVETALSGSPADPHASTGGSA